jgi:hypothetical protein
MVDTATLGVRGPAWAGGVFMLVRATFKMPPNAVIPTVNNPAQKINRLLLTGMENLRIWFILLNTVCGKKLENRHQAAGE